MNTQVIERIKGYCTEVNQAQWEELVRVADEVGRGVWHESRSEGVGEGAVWAQIDPEDGDLCLFFSDNSLTQIPFPDFIAKLRGVEQWQPKAGEMAEFSYNGIKWWEREFIAKSRGKYIGWTSDGDVHAWTMCRPLRHTITRAEAEQQLGKRIID